MNEKILEELSDDIVDSGDILNYNNDIDEEYEEEVVDCGHPFDFLYGYSIRGEV